MVIAIKASGMCGSDLKAYRATDAAAALGLGKLSGPVIAGHEPCGVVAAIGGAVDARIAREGMRAMVHHYSGCGTCPQCRTGWSQMCHDGSTVYGVTGHGAHAPYMKVPAHTRWSPLPDDFEASRPVLLISRCGTGTAYPGAAADESRRRRGHRRRRAGAWSRPLGDAACGRDGRARDRARSQRRTARPAPASSGADAAVIDPQGRRPAVAAIKDLTHGLGADRDARHFRAPPRRRLDRRARATALGHVVCFVGEGGDVTIEVSPDMLRKQLTILASWTFSTVIQADCARFVDDHDIAVEHLFTDRWQLARAEEAYRVFDRQTSGKGVFLDVDVPSRPLDRPVIPR